MISFSFDLRENLNAPVGLRMARALHSIINLLGPFAQPMQARLGTLTQGEDTEIFKLPEMHDTLFTALTTLRDITDVALDCDLLCASPDGSQFRITQAMTLWVSRATLDDMREDCPLQMQISLDVDVYAAVHDERRDNRELARIDAPAFNEFLQRIKTALPAELTDVDACYHAPGLVTQNGFAII